MKTKHIVLVVALCLVVLALNSCDALSSIISMLPGMHEHTWVEATCVAPKTCSDCGATEGEALGHTEEVVPGKAATCTEDGYIDGKKCSVCGEVLVAQDTIYAKGEHTWEAADCENPKTCSDCGETEGEALGHDMDGVPCDGAATCKNGCGYSVENLGHIDENLDIECDREGCTKKMAPKADSTLSVFTANCLGSKLSVDAAYYVEGTIVEVLDARNGIFLVSDGGEETFYFRLPKDDNGVSHANWEVKLVLGDKVRLHGKINKFTTSDAPNGQYYPSMQGCTVEILEQHPHDFSSKAATCMDPAYCHCGYNDKQPLGHIDADTNDKCDRCDLPVGAKISQVKTHYDDVKNTENLDTTNGTVFWTGSDFSVLISKGTTSLNANATNHMRVQNGNELTISALNNNSRMISITFVATSSSYVDELEAFLTSTGYAFETNDLELTIQVDSLASVTLKNTAGKVARIATVKVVYVEVTD